MIVLVLGSGGREHALVRGLAKDPTVSEIHIAPGNPATAKLGTNHDIDPLDRQAVLALAQEIAANLVVIGPEAVLAEGVADVLRHNEIPVFGPSQAAARLETSKAFAKEVMAAANVATAQSKYCCTPEEVAEGLSQFGAPYVVKADGLAGGKGVLVTDDLEAAIEHAAAAEKVVIEEYLSGPEVSLFVVTDGQFALPMLPAQDFKRVGEYDTGANTGGMGSYAPLPWLPEGFVDQVMDQVAHPVLAEMRNRDTPFSGLLYVGLVLTADGPKVIEFNARFGDPETQSLIPLLITPLGQLLYAAATGQLAEFGRLVFEGAAVSVVLAAKGYPGDYVKGGRIDIPEDQADVHVIQAGTKLDPDGELIANGGRVLAVVATAHTVEDARDKAYKYLSEIDFPNGFWRSDIASAEKLVGPRIGDTRESA